MRSPRRCLSHRHCCFDALESAKERNLYDEVLYETKLHNPLKVCKIFRDHRQRVDGVGNSCLNGHSSWERRGHNRYCSAGITAHLGFDHRRGRCDSSAKPRSEGRRLEIKRQGIEGFYEGRVRHVLETDFPWPRYAAEPALYCSSVTFSIH